MADTEEKQETESTKGPGVRSETTYPYFALDQALRVAVAVRQAGGNEATEDEVMQALGLSSRAARAWTYRISSAKEFGLVVRAGRNEDARLRVTDLAKRILMPESDTDSRAAKMKAFMSPKLYPQLAERYKGAPVPSADGLKNVLSRDYGVLESVSLPAAEAFLQSARQVGLVDGDNIIRKNMEAAVPAVDAGAANGSDTPTVLPPANQSAKPQTVVVPGEFTLHQFQLRKDLKLIVPLPPDLSHADVKRLHRWMTTLPLEEPPANIADSPQ